MYHKGSKSGKDAETDRPNRFGGGPGDLKMVIGREPLPLTPVSTRFSFLTADFSSPPWLSHVYTPFCG
jgi:hypothetical protein